MGVDLTYMRAQNVSRLARWHGDDDDWNLADWSNAMCGEAGEAANVVKKMRRTESELWARQLYPGDSGHPVADAPAPQARELLRAQLANELADVVTYCDLLAHHAGINLSEAIARKFNRVSEAQGFPERLPEIGH